MRRFVLYSTATDDNGRWLMDEDYASAGFIVKEYWDGALGILDCNALDYEDREEFLIIEGDQVIREIYTPSSDYLAKRVNNIFPAEWIAIAILAIGTIVACLLS